MLFRPILQFLSAALGPAHAFALLQLPFILPESSFAGVAVGAFAGSVGVPAGVVGVAPAPLAA